MRELESARLWDTNPRLRPPTRPGDSSPVIDGQLGQGKRWKRPENRRRFGVVTPVVTVGNMVHFESEIGKVKK